MSKTRIVHSRLDLKFWTDGVPAVEAVRPSQCTECGAASRCPGRALTVVGHGVRERQLRGPLEVDGEPVELAVRTRRFRCRKCRAVMVVVPAQVLRYRLFSSVAIALALSLFGISRLSPARVRERISPWHQVGATAVRHWQTLRRWVRSVQVGELLPVRATRDQKPWKAAASVVHMLSAQAPPSTRSLSVAHQAVSGVLHTLVGITPRRKEHSMSTIEADF